MTVIYVPRLIESAAQAEALEPGTIATLAGAYPCCKNARQEWTTSGSTGWWGNADMIGWTALMPVEAEEQATGALVNRAGDIHWEESRRLVTPWESV